MSAWFGLGLFVAVLAFSEAWTGDFDEEWRNLERRSKCVGPPGRCFTSSQCCKGFVCAAFDGYNSDPESPGFCVKEKDLEPCKTSRDCDDGKHCAKIGRSRGRFCVDRPAMAVESENAIQADSAYSSVSRQGRGFPCQDDDDCAARTEKGEKMCCQIIKRYRQTSKQMCDKVTGFSKCIGSKRK